MKQSHADLAGPWLRRFLAEYLVTVRNYSQRTRESYRDAYRMLLPFVAESLGRPVDELLVTDISDGRVLSFLESLESARRCSVRTRNQRLAAIVSFARYVSLVSPEHIEWCRTIRNIPFKKCEHRQITYFEKAEVDKILGAPDRTTDQGFRDYSVLLFLYNTGARAEEVSSVCIGDVQFGRHAGEPSVVTLHGKGRKTRQCPLWNETGTVLRHVIGGRAPGEHVFLNRRGVPMTRFGIYELVERHARAAARDMPSIMSKRPSPHTIRHTTATHLLQSGVDINTIRAWLGHVSVDTTSIYAEISMKEKVDALEKCLPGTLKKTRHRWRDDKHLMDFLDSI